MKEEKTREGKVNAICQSQQKRKGDPAKKCEIGGNRCSDQKKARVPYCGRGDETGVQAGGVRPQVPKSKWRFCVHASV